jgi:hypothetical protein
MARDLKKTAGTGLALLALKKAPQPGVGLWGKGFGLFFRRQK